MRYFLVAFLLTLVAGFSFAGDRYTLDSYTSAVAKCTAARPTWVSPCVVVGPVCPLVQNSGSCSESAKGMFLSVDGINTADYTAAIHYDYCSDEFPTWNGSTCVKDDPCKKKSGQWDNGGNPMSVNLPGPLPFYSGETGGKAEMPNTICLDGCIADTTQDRGEGMATSSWWGYNVNPKYNGQSCAPGAPKPGLSKPKTSPEYDCVARGLGFGYVNGVVMCTKADTSSGAAKKSTETTNTDGTKTKVDTVTNMTCNAQGACSTTVTTTTTVINSDGSTASTKTDTKTEEAQGSPGSSAAEGSGFCKENPTSPMCKTGSFGGDCEAGFTCDGDPVGCATARASWMRYCQSKWLKPGNPAASATTLTDKKILPQGGITPVAITENGQCPADKSLTIAGRTVTFSYSTFCQFLGMIRPVIIAAGWLVAAYIVFGLGQKSE